MRSYIVIPEGTAIVRVAASSPRYAASKARGGKGERVHVSETAVMAASAVTERGGARGPLAGQLSFLEDAHPGPP